MNGELICDSPNEYLEKWDGNMQVENDNMNGIINLGTKQLLLKGCKLKNTDYILGFVVYTGLETKIMMNQKK
jgi:magnesium-transporting ATPase (P-type)